MIAWLFCAVGFMLVHFHRVAIAVLAEPLGVELDAPATALGALTAAFFYVYGALQVPAGALVDLLGLRRMIGWSLVVGVAGTLLLAASPNLTTAIIARALVGVGVSGVWVGAAKALALAARPQLFATLLGLTILVGNAGGILGAFPFDLAVTAWGWRNPLYALAAFTALLALVAFVVLPGASTHSGGTVSWFTVRAAIGSRSLWPFYVTTVGLNGPFLAFAGVWSIPYLNVTVGLDLATAATLSSLLTVGLLGGAFAIGWIADQVFGSARVPLTACAWANPVVWLLLALWPAAFSPWLLTPLLLLTGITIGSLVLTVSAAKAISPPGTAATVTGLINAVAYLTAATLQPLFGLVLDVGGRSNPTSFRTGLLLYALVALLGSLGVGRLLAATPAPAVPAAGRLG
ncbi:MAG: MFS transporter [Chloroflexi bacterium]|nr:MFS transporter [Chloroflexota bacterium]